MKLTRTALAKYSVRPGVRSAPHFMDVQEAKRTGEYWNPCMLWSKTTGRKSECIKDPAVARAVAFAIRELGLPRTGLFTT